MVNDDERKKKYRLTIVICSILAIFLLITSILSITLFSLENDRIEESKRSRKGLDFYACSCWLSFFGLIILIIIILINLNKNFRLNRGIRIKEDTDKRLFKYHFELEDGTPVYVFRKKVGHHGRKEVKYKETDLRPIIKFLGSLSILNGLTMLILLILFLIFFIGATKNITKHPLFAIFFVFYIYLLIAVIGMAVFIATGCLFQMIGGIFCLFRRSSYYVSMVLFILSLFCISIGSLVFLPFIEYSPLSLCGCGFSLMTILILSLSIIVIHATQSKKTKTA